MKCPECGSRRVRVVLTAYTDQQQKVRRRHCQACEHRWYTLQQPEEQISPHALHWGSKYDRKKVALLT